MKRKRETIEFSVKVTVMDIHNEGLNKRFIIKKLKPYLKPSLDSVVTCVGKKKTFKVTKVEVKSIK